MGEGRQSSLVFTPGDRFKEIKDYWNLFIGD